VRAETAIVRRSHRVGVPRAGLSSFVDVLVAINCLHDRLVFAFLGNGQLIVASISDAF
jgi:hypothetical protein